MVHVFFKTPFGSLKGTYSSKSATTNYYSLPAQTGHLHHLSYSSSPPSTNQGNVNTPDAVNATKLWRLLAMKNEEKNFWPLAEPGQLMALSPDLVDSAVIQLAPRAPQHSGKPDGVIMFSDSGTIGPKLTSLASGGVLVDHAHERVFCDDPPNDFPLLFSYMPVHYDVPLMNQEVHDRSTFIYHEAGMVYFTRQELVQDIAKYLCRILKPIDSSPQMFSDLPGFIGGPDCINVWSAPRFSIHSVRLLALYCYGDVWVPILGHDYPYPPS